MKHRVHKFNFKGGKDANDMLLRKLVVNFVEHGSMITTEKKGKALSSYIGRIVEKSKNKSEANKNYLLKEINSEKIIGLLFDKVGPVFKDVVGGYLTLQRLQQRVADGATMVKVAWAKPVVLVEPVEKTSGHSGKGQKLDAGQASTTAKKSQNDNEVKTTDKSTTKKVKSPKK